MNRNADSHRLRPYFDEEQRSDEDLEPFDFGEQTENVSGFVEDDYDAINDETFGCAEPITNNDGLELLAERTRMLDLADFGNDEVNFAWPDPADIPLPSAFKDHNSSNFAAWVENADLKPSTSGFGSSDFFMFGNEAKGPEYTFTEDDLYKDLSRHWEEKIPESPAPKANTPSNLFGLLTPNAQPRQASRKPQILTEEMLLKMNEEEEKQRQKNVMKTLGVTENTLVPQSGFEVISPRDSPNVPTANFRNPDDLWKEMQRANQHRPASFYQNNQPPPFIPLPKSPYMASPTRDSFPQRMGNNMPPYHRQNQPLHKPNLPPFTNQPPPYRPMMPPFNGINPNVINLMHIHSNQGCPHGFPPFPPQNFNGSMFPRPNQFPPHFSNMLAQQRASMSNSMRGSNSSLCSSRTKKPFLPSTKTLSDFAFDPYAGLMSKKEREWLIKIQLIQCMVTGDPIEDDYYYSIWKERNVLAKAPLEWRVSIQPKYYNFDNTYPSERYVPPAFIGSLGRPTRTTTSFPRQIIELQADSIDDDTESNTGKSISQKKLRAILLRIENASLSLLECRDVLYKSSKGDMIQNDKILYIVGTKIQTIIDCVASPNELPTIMLVQKGRYLIGQLITYSDDNQASEIMSTLVKSTSRFAHKIPSDSNNQPLLRAIVSKLRNMDLYAFKMLRETLPITSFEPLLEISPFVQQLCLAFMIGLCGKEIQIPNSELVTGPIGSWLADKDVKRLHALIPVFNQDAVDFDLLQLNRGLSFFPPNSIGRQLAELLKTRIKQRPS